MADELINDAFTGVADPLSDTPVADEPVADEPTLAEPDAPGDDQPVGQDQDEAPAGDDNPLAGTPFKDVAAVVKGYKEIQKLVGNKDREISGIKQQLDSVLNTMLQLNGGQDPRTAPNTKIPQGEEFWQAMYKDPQALLTQIVKYVQEKYNKEHLDPRLTKVEGSMSQYQRGVRVQTFLQKHPDLKVSDEDDIVEVMDNNPWLKDREDGLDIAYRMVLGDRYRVDAQKKATAAAVDPAKKVAGLGGKKTTLPVSNRQKDPFDEVLDLDVQERETFKLGRK